MNNHLKKIYLFLIIVNIYFLWECTRESPHDDDKAPDKVEIPFILEKGNIIIEADINRIKGKFIFDTGSTESYGDINPRGLGIQWYGMTVYKGHKRPVWIYKLNKITFGNIELNTKSWIINHSDIITRIKEYGYTGLLGVRIFEGYWCELSFSKQKIILHKEKPDYYINYESVDIISKFDADFYIPVSIENTRYYFAIDTGLYFGLLFPDKIIHNKNKDDYTEVESNEEAGNYHITKLDTVTILDETYEDVYVMTNSYLAARQGEAFNNRGLLGVEFLRYYDFLFDYRDLRNGKTTGMYYTPNTPLEERNYGFFGLLDGPPEFGVTDISFWDSAITINSVIKGSIAYDKFALRSGTKIVKINGKPYTEYSLEELRNPDFYKSIYEYTILEDGNEKTIVVQREYEIPLSTR